MPVPTSRFRPAPSNRSWRVRALVAALAAATVAAPAAAVVPAQTTAPVVATATAAVPAANPQPGVHPDSGRGIMASHASPLAAPVPRAPATGTVFARAADVPAFAWEPVPGATAYQVVLDGGRRTGPWVAETAWRPGDLAPGRWTWHVRARDASGAGPLGPTRMLVVDGDPGVAPTAAVPGDDDAPPTEAHPVEDGSADPSPGTSVADPAPSPAASQADAETDKLRRRDRESPRSPSRDERPATGRVSAESQTGSPADGLAQAVAEPSDRGHLVPPNTAAIPTIAAAGSGNGAPSLAPASVEASAADDGPAATGGVADARTAGSGAAIGDPPAPPIQAFETAGPAPAPVAAAQEAPLAEGASGEVDTGGAEGDAAALPRRVIALLPNPAALGIDPDDRGNRRDRDRDRNQDQDRERDRSGRTDDDRDIDDPGTAADGRTPDDAGDGGGGDGDDRRGEPDRGRDQDRDRGEDRPDATPAPDRDGDRRELPTPVATPVGTAVPAATTAPVPADPDAAPVPTPIAPPAAGTAPETRPAATPTAIPSATAVTSTVVPTIAPSATPSATPTVEPAGPPRELSFLPIADTSVDAAAPDDPQPPLQASVLPLGGPDQATAYVSFEVAGVGAGEVVSATLTVTGAIGFWGPVSVAVVPGYGVDEAALTWNTAPGGERAASGADGSPSAIPGLPANQEVSVDVTGAVDGDGVVTFVLRGTPDAGQAIGSRESGIPARLVVTAQ